VTWINKPLSGRVVLAGSSPQKAGFLVYNWSVTLAEARADNDRSRVCLSQPLVAEVTGLKTDDVADKLVTKMRTRMQAFYRLWLVPTSTMLQTRSNIASRIESLQVLQYQAESKVTGVARYRFLLHATEGTLSRSCKVFPGPIWHFATCVEPINFAIRIRREILLVGGILGTRKRRPEEVLELKSFEKHKNGDCEPAHDVTSVARPFIMWLGNLGPQVLTGLSTTFSAFSLLPTLPFNRGG
jgi:hypothetical protein